MKLVQSLGSMAAVKANWKAPVGGLILLSVCAYAQASPYTDCEQSYQDAQNDRGAAFIGSVFTGNYPAAAGSWLASATAQAPDCGTPSPEEAQANKNEADLNARIRDENRLAR
ncbi:hypothetical protein [Paraburkholderia sp. J8-2]|uniref:hypothetical protein n=1 Tax=Paraburkholderia sp. J8-2 TaxID=2805440 RepID=UPI002AB67F3B|nr:hypothetical protein [Paraburkholderia sp. J8-2]